MHLENLLKIVIEIWVENFYKLIAVYTIDVYDNKIEMIKRIKVFLDYKIVTRTVEKIIVVCKRIIEIIMSQHLKVVEISRISVVHKHGKVIELILQKVRKISIDC